MDRMVYLAMSGAKQMLQAQAQAANNLANVSTTGFRADLEAMRAMPLFGPGAPSRVYAMAERPGIDFTPGPIEHTGNDLDVAIQGDGFIAVQAPDGSEAYTRAGNLKLNANGMLETGNGLQVLGNGGPIAIPPAETMQIGVDGTISIRPVGQEANTLAELDRIKLVNPPLDQLTKGADGLFRMKDGSTVPADATVMIQQGALETSNVNAVSEMINMITMQRNFELQVKAMHTAAENDSAAAQMMRLA
jgi:flagellar basal-body rod protein FlgF